MAWGHRAALVCLLVTQLGVGFAIHCKQLHVLPVPQLWTKSSLKFEWICIYGACVLMGSGIYSCVVGFQGLVTRLPAQVL